MAENTIEIEVELVGQDKALEGLGDIKEGAEGIGETFKGVGDLVGKTNQQMGESLGAVSDAVGSSVTAFTEMGDAVKSVASGGAGLTALLGPIGLLTTAIAAGVEAFRQLSGAAQEAENRQAAFGAAAGDLTSKLEALAENGFVPARKELLAYSRANLQAQIQKELMNNEIEKISKTLQAEADAQARATKAQEDYNKALQTQYRDARLVFGLSTQLRVAQGDLTQAQKESAKAFENGKRVEEVNRLISKSAETYKEFEEQGKEALETKAKELIAQRAALQALEAQIKIEKEADRLTAERNVERAKTADLLKLEKMSREELAAFVAAQKSAVKALNEEGLKDAQLAKKIAELNKRQAEARAKNSKAIDQQKAAQQALREEQMQLVQESQLRQLEIKQTEEGYQQQIALEAERYQLGLALAQDNAMQREIVERQHQLNLKQIEDQKLAREDRADTIRLQRLIKRINMEDALYDAQVKQQEEIAAREAKQYTDFFKTYEMGVARAVAASLFFGDSFKETVAKVLQSLAIEAGARALFQGAAALASYAIGDAKGATEHLASAAIYASAAAAAATGATLLGAGASSGTGGATASPTGAPQVAATPQRDEAESREMTFNLNFGGAVIYDTKEAAKRAMIGDLVRTYNGNNRGMPRFNFAR
jgi:hypothetical protein